MKLRIFGSVGGRSLGSATASSNQFQQHSTDIEHIISPFILSTLKACSPKALSFILYFVSDPYDVKWFPMIMETPSEVLLIVLISQHGTLMQLSMKD